MLARLEGREMTRTVYGAHAVTPGEIRQTRVIYSSLSDAETYAKQMSRDDGVLGAVVTSYVLNEPGQRSPVALFVEGVKQAVGYVSDDRTIFAHAPGPRRG